MSDYWKRLDDEACRDLELEYLKQINESLQRLVELAEAHEKSWLRELLKRFSKS